MFGLYRTTRPRSQVRPCPGVVSMLNERRMRGPGRWMADLSMARKLLLLVAVCCGTSALMLAVGGAGLADINQRAQDIARQSVTSAALLASINSAALQIQADVANVALASGPVALRSVQDRIKQTDTELNRLLGQYR